MPRLGTSPLDSARGVDWERGKREPREDKLGWARAPLLDPRRHEVDDNRDAAVWEGQCDFDAASTSLLGMRECAHMESDVAAASRRLVPTCGASAKSLDSEDWENAHRSLDWMHERGFEDARFSTTDPAVENYGQNIMERGGNYASDGNPDSLFHSRSYTIGTSDTARPWNGIFSRTFPPLLGAGDCGVYVSSDVLEELGALNKARASSLTSRSCEDPANGAVDKRRGHSGAVRATPLEAAGRVYDVKDGRQKQDTGAGGISTSARHDAKTSIERSMNIGSGAVSWRLSFEAEKRRRDNAEGVMGRAYDETSHEAVPSSPTGRSERRYDDVQGEIRTRRWSDGACTMTFDPGGHVDAAQGGVRIQDSVLHAARASSLSLDSCGHDDKMRRSVRAREGETGAALTSIIITGVWAHEEKTRSDMDRVCNDAAETEMCNAPWFPTTQQRSRSGDFDDGARSSSGCCTHGATMAEERRSGRDSDVESRGSDGCYARRHIVWAAEDQRRDGTFDVEAQRSGVCGAQDVLTAEAWRRRDVFADEAYGSGDRDCAPRFMAAEKRRGVEDSDVEAYGKSGCYAPSVTSAEEERTYEISHAKARGIKDCDNGNMRSSSHSIQRCSGDRSQCSWAEVSTSDATWRSSLPLVPQCNCARMRHNVPVTLEVVSTVRPCSQSFTQCGCAGSRFYRVVVLAFDSPVQSRSTSGRQSGRARHWLSNAVLLAAGSTAQSCSMCWQLLPRCGHASNGTNTEVVCAFAPTVRSGSLLAQAQLSDRAYSPPCRYQGARTDWDHCVRGVSNQDAVGQSDQRAVVDWVQRAMQASDQCDMGPGHSDRRALQDLDQHAMSDSDPRAGGDLDQRAVSVLEQRAVQDCDQCLDDSDRLRPAGCDSYQRTIGASDQQAAVHSSQRAAGNSDIHAVEDVAQGAAGDSDLSAMVDSDQMAVRDSNQSAGVDSVLRATGHSGQRAMHYSYQRVVGYLDPRPAVNPSQYAAACLYQHVMADSDQRAEGAPDQRVAGDSDLRAVDDSDQTTAVDSDQSAVADLDRRDPVQCAVCDATERRTGGYSAVEARMNSGVEVRGIGSRRGIIRVTQGFPLADQCAHQSGTSWSPTVHDQLNPKISPYSTASQPSRTLSGPAAESMNSRRKMVAPNTDGPYDSPLLEVSLGHSRELLSKSLLIAVIVQLFVLHYTLLSFPLIRKAPNTFSSPSSAWRRRQRRNTSSKRAFDTAVRFALLGSGTALAILELSETSLDENLCRLFLICSAVYIAPSSRRSIGIMPNKIPVNPFAKPTEDTSESSSKTSQQQSKKRQPSNQDRKVASMTSTSAAAAAVADNAETIAYREAGRQHLGKIPAEDARRILEFWKEPDGYARSGKLLEIKAKRRCDPFVEGQTCTLMVQGVCTQTDDDGVALSPVSSAWCRRQRRNNCLEQVFERAVTLALLGSEIGLATLHFGETSVDKTLCRLLVLCLMAYGAGLSPPRRRGGHDVSFEGRCAADADDYDRDVGRAVKDPGGRPGATTSNATKRVGLCRPGSASCDPPYPRQQLQFENSSSIWYENHCPGPTDCDCICADEVRTNAPSPAFRPGSPARQGAVDV